MKKLSVLLMCGCIPFLMACDAKEDLNKPRTEVRTMIIGGVPAHDRDYQLDVRDQKHQPEVENTP